MLETEDELRNIYTEARLEVLQSDVLSLLPSLLIIENKRDLVAESGNLRKKLSDSKNI